VQQNRYGQEYKGATYHATDILTQALFMAGFGDFDRIGNSQRRPPASDQRCGHRRRNREPMAGDY
jgi:hypothetical protein